MPFRRRNALGHMRTGARRNYLAEATTRASALEGTRATAWLQDGRHKNALVMHECHRRLRRHPPATVRLQDAMHPRRPPKDGSRVCPRKFDSPTSPPTTESDTRTHKTFRQAQITRTTADALHGATRPPCAGAHTFTFAYNALQKSNCMHIEVAVHTYAHACRPSLLELWDPYLRRATTHYKHNTSDWPRTAMGLRYQASDTTRPGGRSAHKQSLYAVARDLIESTYAQRAATRVSENPARCGATPRRRSS